MLEYTVKDGIYYVALSRAQLEGLIKSIDTYKQIKIPSLNELVKESIRDPNVEVIVDFSGIFTEKDPTDLKEFHFKNIDLTGVKFSGLNMQGCKFENAILDSADFSGAIFNEAVFENCRAVSANFKQAKLNNVIIDNSDFGGAVFAESQSNLLKINNKSNLDQASMQNINWKDVIITDSNVRSAKLDNAKIDRLEAENCDLRQSSFNHSVIKTLVAENCDFKQSDLDNANIEKAIIRDSDFSNCSMKNAKMSGAELTNVKLNNVNANGINLHEAVIKSDCQLKNVNFSGADLSYADLNGCTISNADLTTANLLKANLEGASISRARQDKPWYNPIAYIPSATTVKKATLATSKVAARTANVMHSGVNFAYNMFSKLRSTSPSVAQKVVAEKMVTPNVNTSSNSQHYNNIINTINSTRLVSEDLSNAKSFIDNITKVVAGLFDQDYFFPRANNYQLLVAQIEKAHAKGYIDEKYKEEFIGELRKIAIDESQYKTLPHQVLERLLIEKEDKIPRDKLAELTKKLVDNKQENDKEINAVLQEIIPLEITEEKNKLKAPKIAEMQQYYVDRHAEFTHYMLKGRVEQLAKEGILSDKEKNELKEQLRDTDGKFEERVNQQLEKKILINAAEKLKPFLHVLSDPKLFEITQLLGEKANIEQTLSMLNNFKENIIFEKLGISKLIEQGNIDVDLLKYVGIAPSIVSLIIPIMKYEKEFEVVLSGLQDMFRAPHDLDPSQASKNPDQTMNAISTICSLLQKDPDLRRSFTEEIEQMTKVLADLFAYNIQSLGLEVAFINQLTSFSTKIVQAENSEILGLFVAGIAMMQDPQSALKDLRQEKNYSQLKNIVQKVLPRFIENQNADIKSLIEEFLMHTLKGSEINNKIANALGVDATKSLELQDGYMQVISSVVDIAGVVMNHQGECLELIKFFTTKEPTSEQYSQAVLAGTKLLRQKNVREVISAELPKIFAATNGVLGAKLKSSGLSQEFGAQSVDLVAKVVASDEMGKILEFAEGIVSLEIIDAYLNAPNKLPELFINSIRDEKKYNQLKEVIQTSLPSLFASNRENINGLIGEFLKNTTMGQKINQQIAAALGVDASQSLKLQDSYTEVASSAVHIAGVMMNHKTDFMLLTSAGQKLLAGAEVDMSHHYLQAIASGVKLLKQQEVRAAISQELPKIFAATNGVLGAKLKSSGLSQEFGAQSVDLVAKVVASEEMGKILDFTNDLLISGITLDKKGKMVPNEVMNQMINGIREGNYKDGFQGFVRLVGNAGKYKELRTLVQETLPALIQNNKEQIVPLMEEFIKNTALGQKINIDVNDILKIASKKNKNFVDLANYWAKGSYSGILKEAVKLLTSPMVAAFLLEIAGKVAFSYLFEGKKEGEKSAQVPEVPTPELTGEQGEKDVKKPVQGILVKEMQDEGVLPGKEKNRVSHKPEIIIGRQRIAPKISAEQQELHARRVAFDRRYKPKNNNKKLEIDETQVDIIEQIDQETVEQHTNVKVVNDQKNPPRTFAHKKGTTPSSLEREYRTNKKIKSRSNSHIQNANEARENPKPLVKGK